MFQKEHDPVKVAVDLVNTWDLLEADPELLRDTATLKRFLTRRGFGEALRASNRDLVEVRRIRDDLRAAFTAANEDAAVRALNAILTASTAKPQFVRANGKWVVRWVGGRVFDVLAAQTAMSLLEAIRDDGWDRLGICAGAPCCCVFVDRSKNRSRRFCSDLCADRVAQSLHRARVRQTRRPG
jgi:predicted RNA-binding Zn ribbon-like protein